MLHIEDADILLNDNLGEVDQDVLVFGEFSQQYLDGQEKRKEQAKREGKTYAPIPAKDENELLKARLFNFKQLYDFNNLCLNKSFLRKRTKKNEDHIAKL